MERMTQVLDIFTIVFVCVALWFLVMGRDEIFWYGI